MRSQILRGTKKIEYRTAATRIRGKVYIYVSQTPGEDGDFRKLGVQPGDLPTGVLVGTVEIVDCTGKPRDYQWHLKNPVPLGKGVKPTNRPQPVFFHPF